MAMVTVYIDGFDHYTTLTDAGWVGSGSITTSNPRTGSRCATVNGVVTFNASQDWIVEGAHRPQTALSNINIIAIQDAGTVQVAVRQNTDATLSVLRGSTVLATSVQALSLLTYHWIQFRAKIDNVGAYTLIVDGVTWLSNASVDTQNTANATGNQVYMAGYGAATWDDVIMRSGSSGSDSDFLGDCIVTTLYPDGAGSSTEFTPDTGANYSRVDEAQVDADTSYVYSSTPGNIDLYAFGNLIGAPAVRALAVAMHARKDDAGTIQLSAMVRHNSANYQGLVAHSMTSSYLQYRENYDVNPGTGSPWLAADINTAEFGIKQAGVFVVDSTAITDVPTAQVV